MDSLALIALRRQLVKSLPETIRFAFVIRYCRSFVIMEAPQVDLNNSFPHAVAVFLEEIAI